MTTLKYSNITNITGYKAVLLVVVDTLLKGMKHNVSSYGESINITLNEGYEIVIFEDSLIKLKYMHSDDHVSTMYEGYDLVEVINKYKAL